MQNKFLTFSESRNKDSLKNEISMKSIERKMGEGKVVSSDACPFGWSRRRACGGGKVRFHLLASWGWFLGDKVQGESRTRSPRRHPHWQPSFKLES